MELTKYLKNLEGPTLVDVRTGESPNYGTVDVVTKPAVPTSKCRIFKNVFLVSLSYFLLFSAFWALQNLESTMNAQGGMGPVSQAVIYLCAMVSCFVPELLIQKYGCKTTLVLALLFSCPFIASNFHLRWDVVIATSVLYGLWSGPLYTAVVLYLDEMAVQYVIKTGANAESVKAFVFGFFMIFSEAAQAFGSGISFLVLDYVAPVNSSLSGACGVTFDPALNLNNTNLNPPSDHERIVLTGAFLAMSVLAAVSALFLDPLKNDMKPITGCSLVWQKLTSAAKHVRSPHQLLLLPITIFYGMTSVFFSNEFTQAFVACSLGVQRVGIVSIGYGVFGMLMSVLVGPLVMLTSELSVMVLASLFGFADYGILFNWRPSPDHLGLFFVSTGLFAFTDAIQNSQIPALYGLIFPNNREAAFSNLYFWQSFGSFIAYAYANSLTVEVKMILVVAVLVLGTVLFIIGQVKIRCADRTGRAVPKEAG